MHDPRPFLGAYKIRRIYFPSVLAILKILVVDVVVERRFVFKTNKLIAAERAVLLHLDELRAILIHDSVCELLSYSKSNVPRKRPRRCRPS